MQQEAADLQLDLGWEQVGVFYKWWPAEAIPTSYVFTTMAMPELPHQLPAKPAWGKETAMRGLNNPSVLRAVEITPAASQPRCFSPAQGWDVFPQPSGPGTIYTPRGHQLRASLLLASRAIRSPPAFPAAPCCCFTGWVCKST